MIEARDLRKAFVTPAETVTVLAGADLTVAAGECVGLTGASGSGKSTLLNILAGLEPADSGTVRMAGREVVGAEPDELAELRLQDVGVVFQDHNLVPDFTVGENLEVVLRARGMDGESARRHAAHALGSVGIAELVDRRPSEISGGQAQRVGIARALAGGKRIVLADEPTGALDEATSRSIFELLREVAEAGAAVVVCTHDLLVGEYAHRQVALRDGVLA